MKVEAYTEALDVTELGVPVVRLGNSMRLLINEF